MGYVVTIGNGYNFTQAASGVCKTRMPRPELVFDNLEDALLGFSALRALTVRRYGKIIAFGGLCQGVYTARR